MSDLSTRVTTNEVRLSYCHLFTPRPARGPNEKPKYSVTLLIPKSDTDTMNRINAAIQNAIAEGVNGKWNGVRPPQPALPVHDGDGLRMSGEPFGEECHGCWVMTASTDMPPSIVDINVNPIIDQMAVYSGCYGRVAVRFFAYSASGKRGIGCGLDAVQKLKDGPALGRGPVDAAALFGAPSAPAYAPVQQQPMYQQPMYQQPMYQQPMYQQPVQPAHTPAPQPAINPITGQPWVNGTIKGL